MAWIRSFQRQRSVFRVPANGFLLCRPLRRLPVAWQQCPQAACNICVSRLGPQSVLYLFGGVQLQVDTFTAGRYSTC
jgi:hypothetical protein